MKSKNLTLVAISVDTSHAFLYLDTGEVVTLNQGDPRLANLVEDARPYLEAKLPAPVSLPSLVQERTEFKDAEIGTKGGIKFLRVAKSFLKKIFGTEDDQHSADDDYVTKLPSQTLGTVPIEQVEEDEEQEVISEVKEAEPQVVEELSNEEKLAATRERLEMLMGHGKGTETEEFHKPIEGTNDTIVAVHEKSGAIIPGAHNLSRQLKSASKLNDYKGFSKFMDRLSSIIDHRGHSVEDLMKFLTHGDLPIADDGCIVIYKRLRPMDDTFVDVHSRNIRQKVGSHVFMKAGLVDPNRHTDCSNGLHVAALSYLSTFSGDATVIAKVNPEDVFAVPAYNNNKMRVCGYHILKVLPDNIRDLVNNGGSITSNPEGARILNDILQGNHVGILEEVEIGGHNGTNVTYTNVSTQKSVKVDLDDVENEPLRLEKETLDMTSESTTQVRPGAKVHATELVKPKAPTAAKQTQQERVTELYTRMLDKKASGDRMAAASELRTLKKTAKKSWASWGLPDTTTDLLAQILDPEVKEEWKPAKVTKKKTEPKPVAKKAQVKIKGAKPLHKKATPEDVADLKKDQAIRLIKLGELSNVGIANETGLSKDQVYRLRKKFG